MELKTIRLKSIVDLVNDNIQPVQDTDMDTEYHWKIADIEKEDIGIEDDNLMFQSLV
jgi:hypothetical protein